MAKKSDIEGLRALEMDISEAATKAAHEQGCILDCKLVCRTQVDPDGTVSVICELVCPF